MVQQSYATVSGRPVTAVTGCTSGLGRAFAVKFASRGDDLVLISRSDRRVAELAEELRLEYGVTVEQLPADLEHAADRRKVVQRLERGVTTLVNNAAYYDRQPLWTTDIEVKRAELEVNVVAVMEFTMAVLPAMIAARHGVIVNVASLAGLTPGPTLLCPYDAEKAWSIKFTQSLQIQLSEFGIRVQALCPGFMRTPFLDRAEIDPREIPESSFVDIDEVVETSLADLERGRVVSVPGRHIRRQLKWWQFQQQLPRLTITLRPGRRHS